MHTASFGRVGQRAAHTQSITGKNTTCSHLHPHLHNTPEIYFRKCICMMLIYELKWLRDRSLLDALAAMQRWWQPAAILLYTPPPFSKATYLLSTWIESVQAQMQIKIRGFWNLHSSIYQPSEMLNALLLQKTALFLRHPTCDKLRKPCWKVMAFSY